MPAPISRAARRAKKHPVWDRGELGIRRPCNPSTDDEGACLLPAQACFFLCLERRAAGDQGSQGQLSVLYVEAGVYVCACVPDRGSKDGPGAPSWLAGQATGK